MFTTTLLNTPLVVVYELPTFITRYGLSKKIQRHLFLVCLVMLVNMFFKKMFFYFKKINFQEDFFYFLKIIFDISTSK